jgi:acyl carrier protein
MQQLTPRIVAILQKYMGNPRARVENSTIFADLEIDGLDLPMIFLDVEDDFDVQIEYNDEIDVSSTVGSLMALVESRLEAKTRPRTPIQRPKRTWMSTGAELRREPAQSRRDIPQNKARYFGPVPRVTAIACTRR